MLLTISNQLTCKQLTKSELEVTIKEITEFQKRYDAFNIQQYINSGEAWKLEGKVGRTAMEYLSAGVCYLPLKEYYDGWGNHVPSRTKVPPGTRGSLLNSKLFWSEEEKYTAYFSEDEDAWGDYIMGQIEKRKAKKSR